MKIECAEDFWQSLKKVNKPIWLYGMGNGADRILGCLEERGIKVQGVFASDEFVRHQLFHGFTVCSYKEAKEKSGQMAVLLCFGSARPEVLRFIGGISTEQELYAPDVPVYGEGLFTKDYYEKVKNRLEAVWNRLADNWSKETLQAVILYKLTGKLSWLEGCQACVKDTYQSVLKVSSQEYYVDIGAYKGDTVEELLKEGGAAVVWAVEPDSRSFRKLREKAPNWPETHLFEGAAGESSGELYFREKAGRGSSFHSGGKPVPCTTVDALVKEGPVSLIKIDAEGMERQVIAGSREVIRRFRPRMRIACYHRIEDLFSIPEQILSIRPDYQVYMRKYPGVPAWDMEYIFI